MDIDVDLLEVSYEKLRPRLDEFVASFYSRFKSDPALARLFDGVGEEAERRKLHQAMAFIVSGARSTETLAPVLQELGRKHAAYGMRREHYPSFREAFTHALSEVLTESDGERCEWGRALDLIAHHLLKGADLGRTAEPHG
ncbi:MAG: globin domain-containing protein [Gemmatimonadota bacterium]